MTNKIQNKLLDYAPPPPEKVWSGIETYLEEHPEGQLGERLLGYEQMPSDRAWQRIEQRMPEPALLVSFFQRHRQPIRYISTAAVLVFAIVTVSLLIVSKKTVSEI